MIDRSTSQLRKSSINKSTTRQLTLRRAAFRASEALEPRAYLTGFVLGPPTTTATSTLGISPVFANLFPFVTGSSNADLFVANGADGSGNGSVSVAISNGNGTFSTNVDTIPVTGAPLPLAVAAPGTLQTTFDGTSFPDIVAGTTGSNGNPGDIAIMLGNGNGTFQAATEIPALNNNQAIATGIFNDNGTGPALGKEDIIAVSNSASNVDNAAIIFPTGGPGGTPSVNKFDLPFGSVSAVATGDFNGDGHEDFVVVSQANNEVAVFLGNGDGSFSQNKTYATGPSPTSIAVGNFRDKTLGSGAPELDIVTADSTGGEVSFLANNGDGTFAAPVNSAVAGSATGGGPLKVRLANLTGGSVPGLICLLSSGSTDDATALLGNGDGTFHTGTTIPIAAGQKSNAIAAGSLTSSGLTDIVLTSSTQVTTLLNATGGDTSTPTASVTLNPPAGSTSSTTYDFTVTYSDSQQIDASTLGNGNLVVTFPDGVTTQAATLVSMNLGNAATVEATYSITFPSDLTSGDDGAYMVSVNASSVANGGGNFVAAGNIGSFDLTVSSSASDTIAPTASVNLSQPAGSPLSTLYDFTVTYADNVAVNASTISGSNLVVTFPDSSTQNATLVSTNLSNGATVQAVYQISFPADLTTALNGTTYQVSMNANSVTDTSGNPVTAGNFGSFTLTVSPSQPPPGPSGDFSVSNPKGKILTTIVAGVTKQGPLAVTVTNANGTGPITGTITVTLYSSGSSIHDSSAVAIETVVHKVKNLKVGKSFVVHFKPFKYPSTTTIGTDYLVADATLGATLDSTDGASPAITANAPLVHGDPLSVSTTKLTLVAGLKYTAFFLVKNTGNVLYSGPATVGVQVQPTTVGSTATTIVATPVALKVHLNPGQSHKYRVTFLPTNLPASGSDYALVLTINIPGDPSPTSASSTTLLTI